LTFPLNAEIREPAKDEMGKFDLKGGILAMQLIDYGFNINDVS